ncbi:protein SPA1-RELATED 2-like [Cucurbita maxima]|uniref:Protein SPA1-RELATED 2-like n=1 Tax=Cucurbita maxima TaxID=3661 RepID=A0A6J1K1Z8_CUCMA|nr:protein SPA1-RELATED 2-like [Cucurbita maxima]XP_022995467.1 protein SPA1-RELATED 2-like [Cucurbita maxima]XP_022995468.1 protein SPA1-RELATED 2-like [Cucurbita maxima]
MEEMSEEMTLLDVTEDAHVQNKVRQDAQENEYLLKPENINMVVSQEMLMPIDGGYSQDYPHEFTDILEGKNLNRCKNNVKLSDQPECSPHCMDDAGVMVEELTVKNQSSSNLAIIGPSNNRARLLSGHSPWQHLYQLASGSGSGSSLVDTSYKNIGQAVITGLENGGYSSFPESFVGGANRNDCGEELEELKAIDNKGVDALGSIRTKILSKSGFPEYFVKNTLKGKGIIRRGVPLEGFSVEHRNLKNARNAGGITLASDSSLRHDAKAVMPSTYKKSERKRQSSALDGINLREWLKVPHEKVNKTKCLYIFRRIVELVDRAHARGVFLHDLRPSTFRILTTNQVRYFGSFIQGKMPESLMVIDSQCSDSRPTRKRPLEQGNFLSFGVSPKKQKDIQNTSLMARHSHFPLKSCVNLETANTRDCNMNDLENYDEHFAERGVWSMPAGHCAYDSAQTPISDQLEENWYASPEELNAGCFSAKSNIFSLGVLLFELLGKFESDGTLAAAMSNLRDRILPPNFLADNLKEVGFCLWLLHPEPASRPTTREILQSELINGMTNSPPLELSTSIDEEDAESELLLQFLTSLNEQKQKQAAKLAEDIRHLESDIEEVNKRHRSTEPLVKSGLSSTVDGRDDFVFHGGYQNSDVHSVVSKILHINEERIEKNIIQLESAYFSMRSKVDSSENDSAVRTDIDLFRTRENCYLPQKDDERTHGDRLRAFFDGFCKYSRYSKFQVRGVLRSGDFNSSSNVICSLSFDRDEDYFAAAGVSKKIRIFDFNSVFSDSVDIHYPAVEMFNRSKLSCVCWNSYIRNYLASTDYDGVVKLWDATVGQEVFQFKEHEKRAWSVDFSKVHPTKLASGSDDCAVKLWSISEKNSLGTIRNIANVCCVQFSAHSTHMLAFGSADYRTYCFDLRNTKAPWCVLGGHEKAVSYVKFLDSETLVSASTDNTLKLWDLNRTNPTGLSTNACSLTLNGHTNEKNFVGLSVSDSYIACGSETNEVYAYHRSLPMPITSYKFGSIDPVSGKETEDDNGQFVSSVCWRGKSDMVVAANSSGCIKVLQMV